MAASKGKDTSPELLLRKALWAMGHRYRIGHGLPGRPDLVFVSKRVAVFVDGCFWHRCPQHFRMPRSNRGYWEKKIARNESRDAAVSEQLAAKGWQVVRIWEHDLRQEPDAVIRKLHEILGVREP